MERKNSTDQTTQPRDTRIQTVVNKRQKRTKSIKSYSSINEEELLPNSQGKDVENVMQELPFGDLLKARQLTLSTKSDTSELARSSPTEVVSSRQKHSAELEFKLAVDRKRVAKRPNKHSPMELSSKKPITRRRPVVETSKREGRDPRFSDLAGEFSPESFASSYSFISKLQEEEVETLKKALKSAQTKPLDKDPTSQKTEQGEADAIRKALKRAESSVNHNRREERERRTLQAAKTKEMKERLRGKKNWWMKESDKKQLLLQSQFDSLAAEGGRKAVKLAIEKRRKKAMQKDRRSRPQMGEYKRSA